MLPPSVEKHPEAIVNLLGSTGEIPTKTQNTLSDLVNTFWVLELLFVLIVIGARCGMIGMLIYLDDSTLDAWNLKIGPNTVLAILASVCKKLLVSVIATCIAQLRWSYFASAPQRLVEFDTFDGATRGPLGAVKLLYEILFTKGLLSTIVSFGAIWMIAAIAFEPFIQQMLKFETGTLPITGGANPATMPISKGIVSGATLLGRRNAWQSMYGGFLEFDYPIPYECNSGNCTWPTFSSLGLCSSCQDARPLMTFQCASNPSMNATGCSTIASVVSGTEVLLTLRNGSQSLQSDADTDKAYSLVKSAVGPSYPDGYGNSTLFEFVTAQILVNLSNPVPSDFLTD